MPTLIPYVNYYLYEKKKDIIVLKLSTPGVSTISQFDSDDETTIQIGKQQIEWFENKGIKSYQTTFEGYMGWNGTYFIDVDPSSDIITEYSQLFEDAEGRSIHSDYYQLYLIDYKEWVDKGGIERIENEINE